jgi:hypothetical protein
MGTTEQKLQAIVNSKEAIRQSITNKGIPVGTGMKLSSYPSLIDCIVIPPRPSQAILNGEYVYGLTNISGIGQTATQNGTVSMDGNVNIVCIGSDNTILYQGTAGVPAVGSYIPMLKITYTAPSDNRTGYLSIVKHSSMSSYGQYTVVDVATGLPIVLSSAKTYTITSLSPCMILRSKSSNIISGTSSLNNGVFGFSSLATISTVSMQCQYSFLNPSTAYVRDMNMNTTIKNLVQSGTYSHVTISSPFFTGSDSAITGYNKGNIVAMGECVSFN